MAMLKKLKQQRVDNLIYLLAGEEPFAPGLLAKLEQANYRAEYFSEWEAFEAASEKEIPFALVIDTAFSADDIVTLVSRLKTRLKFSPSLIIVSADDDIQTRLAAARAGVHRYFCKPVSIDKLIHTLDGLNAQMAINPGRALLIDDNALLLEYHAGLLRRGGIVVETLEEPLRALEVLAAFNPDIVLMDVSMADCSGLELTQVIRQDDRWLQMPILFLSADADIERQLAAMNLGEDGFMAKPVEAEFFLPAVLSRIKRARYQGIPEQVDTNMPNQNPPRLQLSMQFAGIASWDWNIRSGELYWSDPSGNIWGSERALSETSYENFLATVHSDDRERLLDAMINGVEKDEKLDIEHRVVWPDGSVHWLRQCGDVMRSKNGEPLRMLALAQNIDIYKYTEQELRIAREKAENLSSTKSHFLSTISHEIRTPMNTIMGFSQLLKTQPLDESQQENVVEIINAGNHLLEVINDVLDIAKIESGRLQLDMKSVKHTEVLVEALQLMTPLAQARNIKIHLYSDGNEITVDELLQQYRSVHADRTRLRQVLLNLLSNALKYNCDQGRIIIACDHLDNKQTRISISDSGAGLSSEQQAKLFTAYERLSAEQSEIEGTGIGLLISRNMIELMGGRLGIDSQPGAGSTFWIELPNSRLQLVTENPKQEKDTMNTQKSKPSEGEYTVLYIEDNSANLRLVTQLLGRQPNLRLLGAEEAEVGLDLALTQQPDLILLDINLPGMNGYEMLEELQRHRTTANIPVIAISANAMQTDVDRGLKAGFVDYITKPIDVSALLRAVDVKLSESRAS